MERHGAGDAEITGKKKILIVTACDLSGGGVPVFLYNMLSNMDIKELCIHIYFPGKIVLQELADKFLELGTVLYTGECGEGENVREIAYNDIACLTGLYKYDVIHSNSGKVWINYYSCYFGIKNNIPVRIVHSHNALLPRKKPEIQRQDDNYRQFIRENATDFLACSVKAAKWLFGPDFQNYIILKNGIDLENYKFDIDARAKYHKELGLNNKFVIGHVGRFVKQKNHIFLLEVFSEIIKNDSDCILLMAGGGELLEEIKETSKKMGINNKCVFLGERMDIYGLLNAMDVFVFPSLFEGLPISLIEAQANGLPCVISDEITKEVCLLKEITMLSLKDSAKHWAGQVLKYKTLKIERKTHYTELETEGYSVKNSAIRLFQLYKKQP